jgi:release factor glutamine methyltransferase
MAGRGLCGRLSNVERFRAGAEAGAEAGADGGALVDRLRAAGCVFAEDEAALLVEAAGSVAELDTLVGQRIAGLPLEHVLGWAEFCGLRIAVDRGVFVPRHRTEFLVEEAARLARRRPDGAPPVVLDLCCGCGALGVALARRLDRLELHAADVDPAAVRCARRNVEPVAGQVHHGDLYEPLPARLRGQVDVLLANVPYVPTDAIGLMPPEARLYEPRVALDGGDDGLAILRRVADGAPGWLAPGGHLLVETSRRQAADGLAAFVRAGLRARVASTDEATVLIGTTPTLP